jgi:hypothetical protein
MSTTSFRRGMWVWNGYNVASNHQAFITECKRIKITDVYLYLTVSNYTKVDVLRKFIKALSANGIKSWGLDGGRVYFSDVRGPAGLYASIQALITYNSKVTDSEKFYGFQTDQEPDDYSEKYPDTFHNDIRTSRLSKTSGGVHTKSAFDDRVFILKDWVNTQKQCTILLRNVNLKSGAAFPSWLDDYYGEPLSVAFDGKTQTVMAHMFNYVDDYCIMSYQTDLSRLTPRIRGELLHGNSLVGKAVFAGVETVKGRGAAVTYGDHRSKNKRSAVLSDIATLESLLKVHPSFAGVNIHDWQLGWVKLAP